MNTSQNHENTLKLDQSLSEKIKSFFGLNKQITLSAINGDAIYAGRDLTITQNKKPREAELKIVDISFTSKEGKENPLPILDVKVRNNSDEVVFIKKIEIICLKQWVITNMPDFSLVEVSWTYDITIPKEGNKITYPLSQEIKPNEVDRFELRLRTNEGAVPGVGVSPHLIQFNLIYNENNKDVKSPEILVHIPSYITWAGMFNPGMSSRQLKEQIDTAKDVLMNINKDTIVQENIIKVIKDWANIKQ